MKSGVYATEGLVQKLQQTVDKLICVLVLLKERQAAIAVTDISWHQLLYILTALVDREQLSLKFLGDIGQLLHVAAEEGEGLTALRLLIKSSQFRHVQRGAGDSGKQSISRLQDTDKGNNGNECIKWGKINLY